MVYQIQQGKETVSYAECPECKSKRILYQRGSLICNNCGYIIYEPKKKNKFNATKTIARDGERRDSKFEASIADELFAKKAAGEILDYDSQFKVIMEIYNRHGKMVKTVSHKVDFRVHNRDGSFTLLEAKGVETADYKWRRSLLEELWLPEHPDHDYKIRKQQGWRKKR